MGCEIRVVMCTYITISLNGEWSKGQKQNVMEARGESIQRNLHLEISSELGLGRWDGLNIIVLNITQDGG